MITTNRLGRFFACTHDPPIYSNHSIRNLKPTNRNIQTGTKMVNDNESYETSKSETESTTATRTMGTRSSARLAEKLKKLMDTPTSSDGEPMESEQDDQKKRTRTPATQPHPQPRYQVNPNKTPSLEAKRSRNGATPPPAATAKALLNTKYQQGEAFNANDNSEVMESIAEDDDATSEEATAPAASINDTANTIETQEVREQQDPRAVVETDKEADTQGIETTETLQEKLEMHTDAEDDMLSEEEPEPVREVDPKEWRLIHDEWLHAAMRASMGDVTLSTIPDIENVERIYRNPPNQALMLQPSRLFIKRYDLRLTVEKGDDQVTLFHQSFMKWYQKIREVDNTAILYPWAASDRIETPMPLIENPTDTPIALIALKKFVHKLFLRTTGGDYHVQVLMGTNEDLTTIMQTIGWWLKSTSQGMWLTDLQSAEETMCAGWLLFLAGDYDRENLTQEIWNFIGVQVAIRFRAIDDGKKRDNSKKTDSKAPSPSPPIKALHVDVDKAHQGVNRSRLEFLYSSKATVFPLGIKMRFVRDYRLLTNSQAKAKAECLRGHQERFLAQMETCTTWEIANLDLEDHSTEATIRQIIMNIPDPANPVSKLFHSVNKMFNKPDYILRFHPSRSQNARDVVAGLCVYLKGLWQGVIDVSRLNKFFTDTALDRAKDAWWDPTQRCVMTKADEEMASILQEDKDLIFPTTKVIVDLPPAETPCAASNQAETDPLSTGSVSTFRTTGTTTTKTTRKTKGKVKIPSTANTVASGTDTTLSASTFSEQDINYILSRILQALQFQNNNNSSPNTPPGGEKTGSAK